jgi:glycosyltransferase involved in cell wall biosynthesis
LTSVLQVLGPSSGGIRRHVAVLAAGLEARGFVVSVAGPARVMDGLDRDQRTVPVGLGPSAPLAVARLRPLVRSHDVVHAHGLSAGWLAWAAGAGPKLVVTVHNLVLDEAAGRAAPVLRRLEGALPARAAASIAISEPMRQRFEPRPGGERMRVIAPVGPEPVASRSRGDVRREFGLGGDEPLVVLVGRLHPQKAIDTLVRATTTLPAPARVVVVGDGPQRAELEALIADLDLGERVTLAGARPDAASYLAAADVVVLCSRWEGFGLVVAEALRLGRPVVATDVGPVGAMVRDGETGRLVPPGDPLALGRAIRALLDDRPHAEVLGRAGAELMADRYPTDGLIDEVASVYHDVVPGTR